MPREEERAAAGAVAVDLKSAEALEAVKRLRAEENGRLRALKEELGADLRGRACLVLGSAPHAVLPRKSEIERLLCVNGSPYIAHRRGYGVDLTVIVGFTTAVNRDVAAVSLSKLKGLHSPKVLFISAGDTEQHARAVLRDSGFSFDDFSSLSTLERAAIAGEVCGEETGLGKREDRISNGVFTGLLALWAGAGKVIFAGFSLQGGHEYVFGNASLPCGGG